MFRQRMPLGHLLVWLGIFAASGPLWWGSLAGATLDLFGGYRRDFIRTTIDLHDSHSSFRSRGRKLDSCQGGVRLCQPVGASWELEGIVSGGGLLSGRWQNAVQKRSAQTSLHSEGTARSSGYVADAAAALGLRLGGQAYPSRCSLLQLGLDWHRQHFAAHDFAFYVHSGLDQEGKPVICSSDPPKPDPLAADSLTADWGALFAGLRLASILSSEWRWEASGRAHLGLVNETGRTRVEGKKLSHRIRLPAAGVEGGLALCYRLEGASEIFFRAAGSYWQTERSSALRRPVKELIRDDGTAKLVWNSITFSIGIRG
jgi:hypothetical protein